MDKRHIGGDFDDFLREERLLDDAEAAAKRVAPRTVSAAEAREQLYELLDDVSQSHEPVLITGQHGNAVLVSKDDWRAVRETLHLVSVPGMRESILEGKATPSDELETELDW